MVRVRFGLTDVRRWLLPAAGTALIAVLVLFPPERYGFYPRCPFFEATGWLCPGCGGTRAVAALLRGNFAEAWRLNALVVALVPGATAFGLARLWRREIRVSRGIWLGVGIAAAVFGVWRNV